MKFAYFLTTGLLLTGSFIKAQTSTSRLDTFFSRLVEDQKINGNVLVAEKGTVIYQQSFGFADFARQEPNTKKTRFNFASVSKPFTATAIFQLIEKRKLKLDNRLVDYLQDFPYDSITIRHLLSHTSGLPDIEELFTPLLKKDPAHVVINRDIIPQLEQLHKPLHFPPGQQYEYSNINYCLLALLIERVSNTAYPGYLEKYIFKPAGMKNTLLQTAENLAQDKPLEAKRYIKAYPYREMSEDVTALPEFRKWTYNWAGLIGQGNIISTMEDMLLFDHALYANKLISGASFKLMCTPVRLNNEQYPISGQGLIGRPTGWAGLFLRTQQLVK